MKQITRRLLSGALSVVLLLGVMVSFGGIEVSAESVDEVPYTNYTYWENGATKIPVATKAVFQAFDALSQICDNASYQ